MALTVENGTGLASADALVSLAAFKAWMDRRGYSYADYSDDQLEQAIVRATDYVSESFDWAGYRVKGRTHATPQALAWPRYNVLDGEGWSVQSDSIPAEVVTATIEIARREMVTPGYMTPVVVPMNMKTLKRVGDIEWDVRSTGGVQSNVPVLTAVRDLIGPFLALGGSNSLVGRAVRV